MKKISLNAGTLLAPVPPVLVSCGTLEKPNVFTVAWTGILCTRPPMTYISVRPSRFSHEIIRENGEFAINLPTDRLVRAVDLCGIKSGRDCDKFELSGLHVCASEKLSVPLIEESPLSLECRVTEIKQLGTHDMFMAEIVGIAADKELVDASGRIRFDKCGLLAYSHGEYYSLGKKIGYFGFSVRKKRKKH